MVLYKYSSFPFNNGSVEYRPISACKVCESDHLIVHTSYLMLLLICRGWNVMLNCTSMPCAM